jgi:hypothetical protein
VDLVESDAVAPVFDRVFSQDQVPDALTRVGEGLSQGNVVITIGNE